LVETFYTLKYEALIGFAEIFSLNVYNLLVRLDKSNKKFLFEQWHVKT